MDKIYVPNLSDYKCVTLTQSGEIIRGYKDDFVLNQYVDYDDIYTDNYYSMSGRQYYNGGFTITCIDSQYLTDDIFYRLDIDRILIVFVILIFIMIFPAYHLFKKIWKWL